MNRHVVFVLVLFSVTGVVATSGLHADNPCTVPDNGTGTADLPPMGCKYLGHMQITGGLVPGDTIEIDASWQDFACDNEPHPGCSIGLAPGICEAPGGTLGGTGYCSEDWIVMEMTGTGTMTGFYRMVWVPVASEVHTGPRNPGDPVQTFQSNLIRLYGELFGDPDFCMFRVLAGSDVGLPSPGQTTLTELPTGDFAVDSFFDITYQIEFEGCPGSQLDGLMGMTTDVSRFETGFADATGACCSDGLCSVLTETDCTAADGLYLGDATACLGDNDGDGYDDACACVEPDNGTGTVDLPAKQCPFTAPYGPMYIIDGLPPSTTLELDPLLRDPDCNDIRPACSLGLAAGVCEGPGGSLGGNGQCFDASLVLTVVGTGDLTGYHRVLWVPVFCEIHTGPRNPGDPVQTCTSEMFRLTGELFGDPDFCTFRVTAGADYGLPSPGETTVTQLPSGDFAVDSFFDITYQIEFEGCPGSQLDGMEGTTTSTVRLVQGTLYLQEPPTCEAPNNGGGTVDLPADCPYLAPDEPMYIIEGLPAGSAIELDPTLDDYTNIIRTPGGYLGGEIETFDSTLYLTVTGTGGLTGFNRNLAVPMACAVHTGPRNPGDPVQTLTAEMVSMTGELFGDPDFCTFRVRAGTDNGMAGAGTTVLTESPSGDFAVDSFFDITYEIEFEGCPGSQLDGWAGTTRATVRLLQGDVAVCYPADGDMNGDTLMNGLDIQPFVHAILDVATPAETCHGDFDASGSLDVGDIPDFVDRLLLGMPLHPACLAPDNGSGTVDLPADCPMTAPYGLMYIIDGLPPGSTLELDPTMDDYLNIVRTPGGSLGGEIEEYDATLYLDVTGTGDFAGFNRHLGVPIACEIHTGPRNPGDPVQTITMEMVSLQGELFGDPDFCTFRVRAGSDFGLPSPGQTTLTQLPGGDFAVDSFFDITYQIEFEGCPGSQLDGMAGTTTATVRLTQGDS
ncbi:MAG: hypothetical protein ABII12_01660 [Planctomycetota bacterium]